GCQYCGLTAEVVACPGRCERLGLARQRTNPGPTTRTAALRVRLFPVVARGRPVGRLEGPREMSGIDQTVVRCDSADTFSQQPGVLEISSAALQTPRSNPPCNSQSFCLEKLLEIATRNMQLCRDRAGVKARIAKVSFDEGLRTGNQCCASGNLVELRAVDRRGADQIEYRVFQHRRGGQCAAEQPWLQRNKKLRNQRRDAVVPRDSLCGH